MGVTLQHVRLVLANLAGPPTPVAGDLIVQLIGLDRRGVFSRGKGRPQTLGARGSPGLASEGGTHGLPRTQALPAPGWSHYSRRVVNRCACPFVAADLGADLATTRGRGRALAQPWTPTKPPVRPGVAHAARDAPASGAECSPTELPASSTLVHRRALTKRGSPRSRRRDNRARGRTKAGLDAAAGCRRRLGRWRGRPGPPNSKRAVLAPGRWCRVMTSNRRLSVVFC